IEDVLLGLDQFPGFGYRGLVRCVFGHESQLSSGGPSPLAGGRSDVVIRSSSTPSTDGKTQRRPSGSVIAVGSRSRMRRLSKSATMVPLAEIGRQHVVDVHVYAADERTWVRRGIDHTLIQNGPGLARTARPCGRLPCPPVPRGGGPNYSVVDRPAACPRMAVDPCAGRPQ